MYIMNHDIKLHNLKSSEINLICAQAVNSVQEKNMFTF